jgi:MFS family permease
MDKPAQESVKPILSSLPPPPEGNTTFVAMRHRNFQLYFGGQLISNIGTWMQIIAQGWVVYQLGHSELTLGLVAFASAVPNLIVSPWAGVIVDRMSRRTLLILTQAGAMILAFALGALSFSGVVKEWHVIVLAALLGVVNAFDAPARQAIVPELVGKRDLANAIALNSMMFNSARVIGPAVAGLMLAAVGAAWCFTINGISFLAVILGLWLMKLPPIRKTPIKSPWGQLVGGFKYAVSNKEISGLILLSLVFSLFGISYSTILPAFVEKTLHSGAAAYGWINTATGFGAVTGALLLANHNISHGRRGKMLVITNIAFPLILIAFSFTSAFPLSLLFAYGLGVGFMVQFTTINTLLQTRVDDEFRGRVMALYTITFFGFAPLGNLVIGILGQAYGLTFSMVLFAILSLILSRIVFMRTPEVQKLP